MNILAVIRWDVDPIIFDLGFIAPRWYGVLFASAFLIAYYIMERQFKKDGLKVAWLDSLLFLMVLGTVIGARLGHVIFYEWGYYSQHLAEIPMVWKGGLASHGGVAGIFIALLIWSKYVAKMPPLWIMDRLAPAMAMVSGFIRLGNLMNSEIVGKLTDVPWAFEFVQNTAYPGPRHPTQLYEAMFYFGMAALLYYFYQKGMARDRMGFITGILLGLIFIFRIFIEYFKENQVAFEQGMDLNMGQILSIPIALIGLYLAVRKSGPAPTPAYIYEKADKDSKKKK